MIKIIKKMGLAIPIAACILLISCGGPNVDENSTISENDSEVISSPNEDVYVINEPGEYDFSGTINGRINVIAKDVVLNLNNLTLTNNYGSCISTTHYAKA